MMKQYIIISLYVLLYIHIYNAILINERTYDDVFNNIQLNNDEGTYDDTKIANAIKKSREIIEKYKKDNDIPGIATGVSIKGHNVWTEAFGYTDLENNVNTHVDSEWRMASISKTMTVSLVAKLMEKGKLDLDMTIDHYLKPEIFPPKTWNGKNVKITLGQLLSHSAGIRVSKFPDDVYNKIPFGIKNVTQTLERFKNEPLIFEPGTSFDYSNDGFQIVGAIIESVTGETFETSINKLMVSELGMTGTFAERHENIIARRARYYRKVDNVMRNAMILDDLISIEMILPAGGMISNVPDLLKFGNVWLSAFKGEHGFIKSSTVKKLWTPVKKFPILFLKDAEISYGHGWMIWKENSTKSEFYNKTIILHDGSISGVSTSLMIFPSIDAVVVCLTNLGNLLPAIVSLEMAKTFV